MNVRELVFVVLLLVSSPFQAIASEFEGKFLVFASSFQEAKPVANDVLNLGYVSLLPGNKAKISRYLYKATDNLKPHDLIGHVPVMSAPYGQGHCRNKTMQAPTAGAFIEEVGRWRKQGQGELVLSFAGNDYQWAIDSAAANALRLLTVTDAAGHPLAQSVGYAFLTGQIDHSKPLSKSDLADFYHGDIFHKTTLEFAADSWKAKSSSLRISVFKEQPLDLDLMEFSKLGHAEDVKRVKWDIWAHNVLLLNSDPQSKLIAYQDYGHDFNRNGCYDEQGHKKILMAISQAGNKIEQFVFVEYTYDKNDGYPMLSVGRYYSPRNKP